MPTQFDPGDLWQAAQPFVQTGVERLGEDRTEMLNADQASLALVYQSGDRTAKVVFHAHNDGVGPVEMLSGGPDSMPAEMGEQFESFLDAGMERLDTSLREQVEQELETGAHLLAVLDFSERSLKGVLLRESASFGPEDLVELFTLALE